jgi:creatine kinase
LLSLFKARGTAGVDSASSGGTWDISNADRLGKSEIELVNIFIEGVAQIIRWEQALEQGQNIDAEVAAIGLPKTVTIEVKIQHNNFYF